MFFPLDWLFTKSCTADLSNLSLIKLISGFVLVEMRNSFFKAFLKSSTMSLYKEFILASRSYSFFISSPKRKSFVSPLMMFLLFWSLITWKSWLQYSNRISPMPNYWKKPEKICLYPIRKWKTHKNRDSPSRNSRRVPLCIHRFSGHHICIWFWCYRRASSSI